MIRSKKEFKIGKTIVSQKSGFKRWFTIKGVKGDKVTAGSKTKSMGFYIDKHQYSFKGD